MDTPLSGVLLSGVRVWCGATRKHVDVLVVVISDHRV